MEDLLQVEIVKLEEELTKLKSAVEYIETAKISIEAASKIINTIIKLKEEFDELSAKAYTLIDRMDKIDFPGRLDKIDSKILSVSNEIHSLETRIEAGSKAVSLELKTVSKSILSEVGTNRNDILFYLKKQSKNIKTIHFSIIGMFVFITIIMALYYFNVL
jgi:exonuclease VII small subunit